MFFELNGVVSVLPIDDLVLTQPHFIEESGAARWEYEEEGGTSLQKVKELLVN